MEKWQKLHICKNLAKLQELTDCNVELIALLQADEMLSKTEIDMLNALLTAKGKITQSSYLYGVLQTRLNGYEVLTKSLLLLKQTGAAKILLNGFINNGIKDPLTRCKIHIDFQHMLKSAVFFQGKLCPLQEVLKELNIEELKEIMKTGKHEQEYMDYFLFKSKTLTLVSDTVPERSPIYIPRSISNRVKLDPKLFNKDCPDVFVFREIERVHLSQLAGSHLTSTSDKQLLEISRRFILLKDYPDWEQMRNISKNPIHLIKAEVLKDVNGQDVKEFVLEATHGTSVILWDYIQNENKSEKLYITESEFLDKIKDTSASRGVCICDTPGMGKTFLLGNMARKLKQNFPERLIAFLPFAQFMYMFHEYHGKTIDSSCVINMIIKSISSSPLANAILLKQLNKTSSRIDLFLDGLDEVPVQYFLVAAVFLKSVLNAENISVYVTSRPHLKRQLEQVLEVMAYDILPFTTSEQVSHLVQTWRYAMPDNPVSKLETFASLCLENVRSTVNRTECDIMGIPLQCYILANLYIEEARLYSDPRRDSAPKLIKSNSVHEMYKNFLDMRFNSLAQSDKKEFRKVKSFHIWMALVDLCPSVAVSFARHEKLNEEAISTKFLSCRIVEISWYKQYMIVKFLHRTLAEFIVAEYLTCILFTQKVCLEVGPELLTKLITWFATEALSIRGIDEDFLMFPVSLMIDDHQPQFNDSVITYFLNESLGNQEEPVDSLVSEIFFKCMKTQKLFLILHATIIHDFSNIFHFLKSVFLSLSPLKLESFKNYLMKNSPRNKNAEYKDRDPVSLLLDSTCIDSSLHMTDKVFELFRDCFKTDLNEICFNMPTVGRTILAKAIRKMDYERVEYLIQKFPTENQGLIYYWMRHSAYGESIEIDQREIEIFELLRSKIKNFLTEPLNMATFTYTGPLGHHDVPLQIAKFLVNEGADVYATAVDNSGKISTIIHNALSNSLSGPDFPELCRFLIKDCKAFDLFKKVNGKWNGTIHEIIRDHSTNESLIQMIIEIPGFDVNEKLQGYCDNVLMTAVFHDTSKTIIDKLIYLGASLQNDEGVTALSYAAHNNNIEYIDYFLSLGLNINCSTEEGDTAIYWAAENLETLKYIIAKGADVFVVKTDGNNILHEICKKSRISKSDLHDLLLLISGISGSEKLFKAKNSKNQTPLHIRLHTENNLLLVETLDLFKFSTEDINYVDVDGNSLLILALKGKKTLDIIKKLVMLGVDCKTENKVGMNAVDVAKSEIVLLGKYYHTAEQLRCMEEILGYLNSIING